jgi:hypothetical protein
VSSVTNEYTSLVEILRCCQHIFFRFSVFRFVLSPWKGGIFFLDWMSFFFLSFVSLLVSWFLSRAYGCAVCVKLVPCFGKMRPTMCTYRHSLPPTNRYGLAGWLSLPGTFGMRQYTDHLLPADEILIVSAIIHLLAIVVVTVVIRC